MIDISDEYIFAYVLNDVIAIILVKILVLNPSKDLA
jgi:hypothetical protein